MTKKIIRGSGGVFGRSRTPTRAPDTLNSRQFASIQDLLSEGEIEGFATASKAGHTKHTATYNNAALKDIFLDGTPLMNANGDLNFTDVEVFVRHGANNQTAIKEINAVENTIPINVEVQNSPFTSSQTGTFASSNNNGRTVSGVL